MTRRAVIFSAPDLQVSQDCANGVAAALGCPAVVNCDLGALASLGTDDFALVRGLRGNNGKAAEMLRERGVPTVILDAGWYPGNSRFRLAIGGLNWIHPGSCPEWRARECGLIFEPIQRDPNGYILLLGQARRDVGHGIDIDAWASETLVAIRCHTKRRVMWRPHPNHRHALAGADIQDIPPRPLGHSEGFERGLEAAVRGAWAVVTYNSSAALEALRLGVPLFADAASVFYMKGVAYSATDCTEAMGKDWLYGCWQQDSEDTVTTPQPFLNCVAFSQWTQAELSTPLPWGILQPAEAA